MHTELTNILDLLLNYSSEIIFWKISIADALDLEYMTVLIGSVLQKFMGRRWGKDGVITIYFILGIALADTKFLFFKNIVYLRLR